MNNQENQNELLDDKNFESSEIIDNLNKINSLSTETSKLLKEQGEKLKICNNITKEISYEATFAQNTTRKLNNRQILKKICFVFVILLFFLIILTIVIVAIILRIHH